MMPRQPGWQHTIKDIHSARHAVDQIFGRADSHQVARFVFGQERRDHIQRSVHLLLCLPHRESADGNAGRIERGDEFGGLRSEVCLDAALHDAEQSLVWARLRFEGALCPAMSPLHGEFGVSVVIRVGAFVECHDDVCAEVFLDRNGFFGREAVCRAVNVTLEGHAVIVDLAGLRQGKDLKAARSR